jgi:hypothetical protein
VEEREDFLAHLQDPTLATELIAKTNRARKPWWERTFGSDDDEYDPKPEFIDEQAVPVLPPAVKEKAPTLKWNLVAVLLSFSIPEIRRHILF